MYSQINTPIKKENRTLSSSINQQKDVRHLFNLIDNRSESIIQSKQIKTVSNSHLFNSSKSNIVTQFGLIDWSKQYILPTFLGGHEINLENEEANGGHSLARHGAHIPLLSLQQRVMGIHPTMPQSRTAMKFNSLAEHRNVVNEAYQANKGVINGHFGGGGGYYTSHYAKAGVGTGFTNTGTRAAPVPVQIVVGTGVDIAFAPTGTPRGWRMDSAYPTP